MNYYGFDIVLFLDLKYLAIKKSFEKYYRLHKFTNLL